MLGTSYINQWRQHGTKLYDKLRPVWSSSKSNMIQHHSSRDCFWSFFTLCCQYARRLKDGTKNYHFRNPKRPTVTARAVWGGDLNKKQIICRTTAVMRWSKLVSLQSWMVLCFAKKDEKKCEKPSIRRRSYFLASGGSNSNICSWCINIF